MFGIEFAPGVVVADGTVRNLAWRICNAKSVLVSIDTLTLPLMIEEIISEYQDLVADVGTQ